MLKIRPDQMQTFNNTALKQFRQRLMAYLRAELPEETGSMSDPALLERVIESEQRAAKYDIRSEAGIAQWACLTFGLRREFDSVPDIQAYLTDPKVGISGESRLAYLVEHLNCVVPRPGDAG